MLNLLFNTLLTIALHNTQKRRRRKEKATYGPLTRYSAVLQVFTIKELDLSDTNQQPGSTEL